MSWLVWRSLKACTKSKVARFISSRWSTRTHTCGELSMKDVGTVTRLSGWVQYHRMGKFLVLRDAYGVTQCIYGQDRAVVDGIEALPLESVLAVEGIVRQRPPGMENNKLATGDIEVEVISVLEANPSSSKIPFLPAGRDYVRGKEELRLRHRYLDLRHPDMQDTLRLRSRTVMAMRTFLVQNGFIDIETPTLTRRTPGGAREFVSPSHAAPGKFYSLSQSPQQFKQLLMMGGVDRYFQVARCYRDESGRSDRQPEFTQIDIELSFTDMEGVMDMAERLVVASWPEHLPRPRTPFSRMTYADVLEKYGTDKPDLRFNCEIRDVTNIFNDGNDFLSNVFSEGCVAKCIHLTPDLSRILKRKELEQIELIAKSAVSERGGPLIMSHFEAVADGFKSSLLNKCQSKTKTLLRNFLEIRPGDQGYVVIGEKTKALSAAGRIRTELARHLLDVDPGEFRFLWVVDFPLFEPSPDGSRLESTHHPFTRPREEDAHLLDSGNALAVRSDHYDLVLNGHEIAGGSMRIHDAALQERIISEFLGEDASALRHLIEALKYGCPPHGGIAFGLDRILALLANANSIRDVIAFPKTADGRDLLFGAPADISQEEKDYYHIKINSNDEEKL